MKLNVNLDALWQSVKNMGAEEVDIDLAIHWRDTDVSFDDELSGGLEITLDDLEQEQGLLSVRGRQVVLFIPDHGANYIATMDNPKHGRKFHIADCATLNNMRRQKKFERYKVTTDHTGDFPIYGLIGGRDIEGNAKLHCCQNCLKQLNYKGAYTMPYEQLLDLAANLDIAEFFCTYSSLFRSLPKSLTEAYQWGYTEDWPQISLQVRKEAGYKCQHCKVDLSSSKRLLHVHHINGIKSDNSLENLVPLCADCHRKEPYHAHMHVKHEAVQRINHLRREQGLIDSGNWDKTIKLADPAVFGVLDHCKHQKMKPPEVGYELVNDKQEIVAELELAWPEKKIGVYIDNIIDKVAPVAGWRLLSLPDALKYFGKNK